MLSAQRLRPLCLCLLPLLLAPLACPTVISGNSLLENYLYDQSKRGKLGSYDVRPRPSNGFPILPLIESADTRYDPDPDDIDEEFLLKRLGPAYDRQFMSKSRPLVSLLQPNGTLEFPFKVSRRLRVVPQKPVEVPKELMKLFSTDQLPNGLHVKMHLKGKHRRKIFNYLWAYTFCPVLYRWVDLGPRFWPRWIREGQCLTGQSCSVPPGMTCRPDGAKTLELFRWHCKDKSIRHCKWLIIQYPVLTSCKCACAD